MRKYIDLAFIWDTLLAILFTIGMFLLKPYLKEVFDAPKIENVQNFGVSLITVCAALIGFMLTIITVIVTFKKGYEHDNSQNLNEDKDSKKFPEQTIFDKKAPKEEKFYGTPIHKKVVDAFVNATYEIGVTLCALLIIQFNIIDCSIFTISVISCSLFLMIILSILRSLFIFRLFLNVHLHDKTIEKYN